MKIMLVWIIVSVANSSGVRTQSGDLKFPTKEDCEKIRMVEYNMMGSMVKAVGKWNTSQDLDVHYQSKCEQANVYVLQ